MEGWKEKYYFYVRLAFGCRYSPKICDTLSTAICWIIQNKFGISVLFHLLDDFLTIDKPDGNTDHSEGLWTMPVLPLFFFKFLGIPLSPQKTVGPTLSLEYLWVILDSEALEARLPLDKVKRISDSFLKTL